MSAEPSWILFPWPLASEHFQVLTFCLCLGEKKDSKSWKIPGDEKTVSCPCVVIIGMLHAMRPHTPQAQGPATAQTVNQLPRWYEGTGIIKDIGINILFGPSVNVCGSLHSSVSSLTHPLRGKCTGKVFDLYFLFPSAFAWRQTADAN